MYSYTHGTRPPKHTTAPTRTTPARAGVAEKPLYSNTYSSCGLGGIRHVATAWPPQLAALMPSHDKPRRGGGT